ncbi:MAG: hypothetical protein V4689_05145 [Verrucomicrobiota bacterium]
MKTIQTPALLALAGVIAMLCASCADDTVPGNQRKAGNPAKMQSSDNTLGRDVQ